MPRVPLTGVQQFFRFLGIAGIISALMFPLISPAKGETLFIGMIAMIGCSLLFLLLGRSSNTETSQAPNSSQINNQKWLATLTKNKSDRNWEFIVRNFFIQDNIEIDKYVSNAKANHIVDNFSGLSTWEQSQALSLEENASRQEINPTPSFRQYYCENRLNRAPGFPDWFYIGYPDVTHWYELNADEMESKLEQRESEFFTETGPKPSAFRFIINSYKSSGRRLECSI